MTITTETAAAIIVTATLNISDLLLNLVFIEKTIVHKINKNNQKKNSYIYLIKRIRI